MTPEQIAELEALAEKATPGPWEVEEDPTQDGDHATLVCLSGKFGTMGTWLLGCFHNWKEAAKGERRISWKEAESNAALIVALRNNLPAILAALKAQQADAQAEPVAWLYEAYGVKQAYAYQLPDWSPSKGTETPLYVHPPKAQQPGEDVVERVARALAASDGLDFDEVCGVDANPDEGYCDSGTCIAAYWEEHDAEEARRLRMHHARAAIAAMQESRDAED